MSTIVGVGVGVSAVRAGDRVKHYKVLQSNESSFHVEPSHRFSSLVELVEYYQNTSLNNGGTLGSPCRRVSQAASRPPLIPPRQEAEGPGFSCASLRQDKPSTPGLLPFPLDEWELPKEEFALEEELGSGCFAHVYRGRWKNLIKVAIKILKSGTAPSVLITSGFCF